MSRVVPFTAAASSLHLAESYFFLSALTCRLLDAPPRPPIDYCATGARCNLWVRLCVFPASASFSSTFFSSSAAAAALCASPSLSPVCPLDPHFFRVVRIVRLSTILSYLLYVCMYSPTPPPLGTPARAIPPAPCPITDMVVRSKRRKAVHMSSGPA